MPDELIHWKTLDRERLMSVQPWFEVWREEVQLPDGRIIPDYYMIRMPDACVVVALTQDRKVIVLRQYKHGVGSTILGLPAGFLYQDEPPMQGAQRELLEETGFAAEKWIDLGNFVRNANRGSGSLHVFLALVAHQVAEPDSGDLEEVQIQFVDLDDLMVALQNDQVKVMGFALAMLLAKDHLLNNFLPCLSKRDRPIIPLG